MWTLVAMIREQTGCSRATAYRSVAAAIAQGGDLGSLLLALKGREARRDQLRADLAGLGQAPTVTTFDLRRFGRHVRARLTDWRGVLHRQTTQARQIL
jgi:hypothetical protein